MNQEIFYLILLGIGCVCFGGYYKYTLDKRDNKNKILSKKKKREMAGK